MPEEFGATAWGRAWLRTIESTTVTAPNPLLPKARSLARNNAVTLTVTGARLSAEVVESARVQPVRIELPGWPDDMAAEAARLITETLAEHRGLSADDLPDELETDLQRRGIAVAVPLAEQESECACRTRKRPCQHILATLYLLVQRIDERPKLAVEIRAGELAVAVPRHPDWVPLTDLAPDRFYGS